MSGRSDHSDRSRAKRIERLRRRLDNVPDGDPATEGLIDVVKGMLDLLEDKSAQ